MANAAFSWKTFSWVLLLTLLLGAGEFAVAHQFNDGKITQKVVGSIFLGMALPSLIMGGVMRMFRPKLQRYFAITAGIFLAAGLLLILG